LTNVICIDILGLKAKVSMKIKTVLLFSLILCACSTVQMNDPEVKTLCSDSQTVFESRSDKIQLATVEATLGYTLELNQEGTSLKINPKKSQRADDKDPNRLVVTLHSGQKVWLVERSCGGMDLTQYAD
jgi:cell division protein FtsL